MRIRSMKGGVVGMSDARMISLGRKQLYDEIWQYSAMGVAKKYNLHYARLISSLKEANIPYPPSGYWTRLACGKDVSKEVVDLPESEIEVLELYPANFAIPRKRKQKPEPTNVREIKQEEESSESNIESTIENKEEEIFIPDSVLSFLGKDEKNKVIEIIKKIEVKSHSRLHPQAAKYKQSIQEWKQKKKEQNNRQHGDYYQNRYYKEMEPPLFVNEVSTVELNRVIHILDTIFKTVEVLGGEVQSNLSMKIRKDLVSIKFAEGQNKSDHDLSKEEAKKLLEYKDDKKQGKYTSKPNIRKYDYTYNGKLRIIFDNGKYIRDNEQKKLEDKLDEIMIQLYENSEEHRIDRERREEAHRRYLEEKRLEEERKERVEKEQKDTVALMNEAKDYQIACEIRNYISAVCQLGDLSVERVEWVNWAKKKADWFDPTIALTDEYLEVRNHALSEDEKAIIQNKRNHFRGW